MIYLVSREQRLLEESFYKVISPEESLELMKDWKVIQLDSETGGRDPHLCKLLCLQLGNDAANARIVIDANTTDIKEYKELLEDRMIIGQNLKFDLQFLYNYEIIPRKIYDTMIVEQLIYLGWPTGMISYSLKEIAYRRLNISLDKTIRGEIIWRGLDLDVIRYAASDVTYLEKIMWSQVEDLKKQNLMKAAKLECDFVPSLAYMEWCGILLSEERWREKMANDQAALKESLEKLNRFVTENPLYSKYTYINRQGSLFEGFDLSPKCKINWNSPSQVTSFAKELGFDTTVKDKKTGEDKDSVLEKTLVSQKGINDEFLKVYFDYKEHSKVCSTYGQGHLNMINPKTGRIHTTFKQLGASSGRLSCGSRQPNTDLAKAKHISPKDCTYCNLQQLPADEPTRSSFVAPEGYNFVSADFSAEESRLAADIYQDEKFLKEFTEGLGDTHNMFAWAVFKDKCIECGCKDASEVKKKAPQWRKKVKAVEFAYLFGSEANTLSQAADCTVEEAQGYIDALNEEFKGLSEFAKKGAKFVRQNGYILICKYTGHRMHWWDFNEWKERQRSFTQEFWEEYRNYHKGTGDAIALEVRQHFQAVSKYDRLARNSPTQGTGAVILKDAMTALFNWIVDHGYFGIIHICVAVHDEINCDYPKDVEDFPKVLTSIMENSAAKYCHSLPIPAEASVGDHWIH